MSELAVNPPPASRELGRVLRKQLGAGGGLSLIIGKSLATNPDQTFVDVEIEGAAYTIPRLQSVGSIGPDRPVYILADATFNTMLAIGWIT